MASTISSATLTVTVAESLVLNGVNQGSTKKITISDITEVSKRIMTIPSSSAASGPTSAQIFKGHLDTVAAGQFLYGDVKYIRITNLDREESVSIHIEDTSNGAYTQFLIPAQHVFFLTDAAGSYGAAGTIAIPAGNIESIEAMGNTAEVDIEIMVASGE